MKKLISVLVVLSMLFSLSLTPSAFSADADESYSKVVGVLSDAGAITKTGLKASTEQSRSGGFSAIMEGAALSKNTTIPVTTSDFSKATFIEVAIYSPEPTSTAIGLLLHSDNPTTPSKDYYYAVLSCAFQNWKNMSYRLDSLRTSGTPKGLDSIDSMQIIPGYGGAAVDPHAKLYIDDIIIKATQSDDANVEEEIPDREPLVIYEAEKQGKREVVEIGGKKGAKWGPGEDDLIAGLLTYNITPDSHLDKYEDLVIEMYSVKNTGHIFGITWYGEDNPETEGRDFYWTTFPANWEGEWREIRIPIRGGNFDAGGLSHSRSPLFKPDQGNVFYINGKGTHGETFVNSTEVYVSKVFFDGDTDKKTVANPTGDLIYPDNYNPKTMTDYVAMVKERFPNKAHPRLLINDEILNRIKKYKDTDPFMKAAYNSVKKQADTYLTEPPPPALGKMETGSVTVERNHLEDVAEACGIMYLLTGEKKYAERIWLDVQSIIDCDTSWVSSSNGTGLDSGHNSNGIALAYDWCYDVWTKEQKQYMRNGVMKYALYNTQKMHNGGGYLNIGNNTVPAITNGYVSACLAWCDESGYENFCNEVLNSVIKYLPTTFLFQYEPDGMYGEGIGYWWYSVTNFAYMLSNLEAVLGTDGGLGDHEGFSKTAYMPFAVRGPKGAFNFSDSSKTSLQYGTPVYFYLDERYNIPAARAMRLSTYEKAGDLHMLDLVWYNPEKSKSGDWRSHLPKDYFMKGLEPIISMRSSYEPDAYYIAGKGGNSRTGHDQYDAGSFVMDALGVRWIEEPGSDVYVYDTPYEWRYRVRPEGNNCLFVDPTRDWGAGAGQTPGKNRTDTMSVITASGANEGAAYGITDNAPSYQETLTKYERGFALINNRTQFIVRDEIETISPYEVYSYYHTTKGISLTVSEDKKSVTMKTKDGLVCKVDFFSDMPGFEVGVMDAVPHPSSPRPGPDNIPHASNAGLHKIYFRAPNVSKGHITAVFTPMMEDKEADLPEILPLSDWSKYLEMNASLEGIAIDGIALSEFSAGVGSYKFETEKVGTVTATADENVEVSITQAAKMGESAHITATNKNTGKSFDYTVTFVPYTLPGIVRSMADVKTEAENVPEPQNPPANMYDGDLGTRYAMSGVDGSANFTVDLGMPNTLKGFSVSFYNGHTRKNKFDIEISMDKQNWTKVYEGFTTGTTDALVAYEIAPTTGQYVRFTGYGCYGEDEETVVSKFTSITEFSVYGDLADFSDTKGHWAQPEIYFARNYTLVNGVGDNTYMPENPVTRAEFITMMVRACEFPETLYEDGTFGDVKKTDWFANNIMTAKEKGIIPSEMTKDGNFQPNKQLTREEMCAIAVLAFTASTYRDAPASGTTAIFNDLSDGPYLSYIDKAIGLRITNGMSADTFAPSANITRAQAAAILRRVFLKVFNTNN